MQQNKNQLIEVISKANSNLEAAYSIINHSYLDELKNYEIVKTHAEIDDFNPATDMRLFKIERIVQDNKQSILESTTAAYTALGTAGYNVFILIDSNGKETDLYIGTTGEVGKALGQSAGELLKKTFKGHFAGSLLNQMKTPDSRAIFDKIDENKNNPSSSITAVTGVPGLSTENNDDFIQGIERLIDAAEGEKYQALILAEPIAKEHLDVVRIGYEKIYTQLSTFQKDTISYSKQDSETIGTAFSMNLSESLGESISLTETTGITKTHGKTVTESISTSKSTTTGTTTSETEHGSFLSRLVKGKGGLVGLALGGPVGMSIGIAMEHLLVPQKSHSNGTSYSNSETETESYSTAINESIANSYTQGKTTGSTTTRGQSTTNSKNQNITQGQSIQITKETTNKSIEQLLLKIDHHLKRIDEAKSYGGWNSAAYFIGENTASSEALASIYLGLIRGHDSNQEEFSITTWNDSGKKDVLNWLKRLKHPILTPKFSLNGPIKYLSPTTLISGKELAIQLSLPRRSTSTVTVLESSIFGRKIQSLDRANNSISKNSISIGNVRHLWETLNVPIFLDIDKFTSHVFVTGSTGSGKSNTLYQILDNLLKRDKKFLVIEPAKGEYKYVFGNRADVNVFGTNPKLGPVLKLNPFSFPDDVHILEHIDKLVEIFNACWPMYSGMPAVLKDAILTSYTKVGWDLDSSVNRYSNQLYPSFNDLLQSVEIIINNSAFSNEIKSNYIGALSVRIKSLTNGLNKQIFNCDITDYKLLFDENTIIDLSRVGSVETKSLIMGLLVMSLSEYRISNGGMNSELKHVTVLEEAHNILSNQQNVGPEGVSISGKSVEMITNMIAEMRTFGEGFIIVDQSPNSVDIAAIRNTNTKIIMRLPDEIDQRLIGKSAGLTEQQIHEIAKLPKGVAIIYQNDWLEPILCQIDKFNEPELHDKTINKSIEGVKTHSLDFNNLVKFLISSRIDDSSKCDLNNIKENILQTNFDSFIKAQILDMLNEIENEEPVKLFQTSNFYQLAVLLASIINLEFDMELLYMTHEPSHIHNKIHSKLSQLFPSFTMEMLIAVEHCLLKFLSSKDKAGGSKYQSWRNFIDTKYRNK